MSAHVELLADAFSRVREIVHHAVEGLDADAILWRPDPAANSIGWLIWHLTRIEDDHIAGVADIDQRWLVDGWADRFDLPYDRDAHGYGQSSDDVGAFDIGSAELLLGYHDDVHEQTIGYLAGLSESELDRVIDERWDPPVTVGVRLISVVSDTLQHAGQAAYIRGLAERR